MPSKSKTTTNGKRGPGRPPGSGNKEYVTQAAKVTRCAVCGSTDRGPARSRPAMAYQAYKCTNDNCVRIGPENGACDCGGSYRLPVTHRQIRFTICNDCQTPRREIVWLYRPRSIGRAVAE